jgi:tetratricopeptide (TPR) repeat protein
VLDYGLRMADAWPHALDLTVALAPYVERSGQWETWRQQLQRAIALAEQQQDVASKLQLLMLAARLSQRQGRLAETIAAYRRVIRLARQAGNHYEAARACSNLGYLFIDMGRFWCSEILCRAALTN